LPLAKKRRRRKKRKRKKKKRKSIVGFMLGFFLFVLLSGFFPHLFVVVVF